MIARLLLTLAMILAVAGAAHADWDDRPDPAEFEESLAPHGYWVDDAQFGHVWRPNTWWTWQPYVDGRWIWSSYGWTWVSDEPWGWTFHYGRWGFSNLYGWVWTPGYVWGPAWVDWYWGDGYVGWVPLGPPGFVIGPTYWTYVRDFSFCSPRITNVVVVQDRLPAFIVHHREQGWGRRHAPDVRDIEHVSRFRVERAADRPEPSIAPWVKHRIERGERLRERVADAGGERVIEHQGRDARDRGRPQASGDGWRRQNDRGDRDRHVIEQPGRRAGDEPPVVQRRGEPDDRMRERQDDGVQHRRRDDTRIVTPSDGREGDGFRRGRSAEGSGWARPAPQPSQPFEAPSRQPSMGSHGAGGGPVFIEGRPGASGGVSAPRGDTGPRGDAGSRGEAGTRGAGTMQHDRAAGGWSGGRPSRPAGPPGQGGVGGPGNDAVR